MFNKKIAESAFLSAIADRFFNIGGSEFNGDRSFTASLRALLNRRSNNESIYLRLYIEATNGFENVETPSPRITFEKYGYPVSEKNSITLYSLVGDSISNDAVLKVFDSEEAGYTKIHSEFREMRDLSAFVKKAGGIESRFYINEAGKETVIVCSNLTLRTWHLLQSLIPRLLPWFFAEVKLDEVEQQLLRSLTYRYAAEYERILAELASRIDFREQVIRSLVGDFEKSSRREEIESTKREIESCRSHIREIDAMYADCLTRLEEFSIRLIGQETALNSAGDNTELIDYFICNKNITPTGASGRRLSFTVKAFLASFDPELYRTYIRNNNSFLYNGYNYRDEFRDPGVRRKILDAIFSDDAILKVKICSNYIIDIRGVCSASARYRYGEEFTGYIPNPHIQQFACIGSYATYINQAIREGNLIAAIEQCVASAKSLNLAEGHTVRYFLSDLFSLTSKVIQLPDGRDVTTAEALEYLNSLETNENENKEGENV